MAVEKPEKNPVKGTIYVVISAILFSLGGVLIKEIPWSALSINGVRNILSLVVMLIYMKSMGHTLKWTKAVWFVGISSFLTGLTFVYATKLTSAANAIVLQFTAPIFAILIVWLYFKKKPDRNAVVTCIIVFVGILCFFVEKVSTDGMIGNLLALFSGLTYAVVFLTKDFEGGDFESAIVLSSILSIVTGVPDFFNETDLSTKVWIYIVVLGVFQFAVAFIFLSKGLDHVSPVTAAITSTIEPILNPILVAIFCGEVIGRISMVGAVIVIGASAIYNINVAKSASKEGRKEAID